MHSIIIIVDYFGRWPDWFPLFLESCRWNTTIDWLIHSDSPYKFDHPDNVTYRHVSRSDYVRRVSDRLGITFAPSCDYKLCDLRPAYGSIYEEEIRGYDFYGYGDIDVIYGDLRRFYSDQILFHHDVISAHNWCVSGHLALLRNTDWLRNLYKSSERWQSHLEDPEPRRFDEDGFMKTIMSEPPTGGRHYIRSKPGTYYSRLYLREQFTTPLTRNLWTDGSPIHPKAWYWKDGHITNDRNKEREFVYLHFMNYRNARNMNPSFGSVPYWEGISQLVRTSASDMALNGLQIDSTGFHRLGDDSRVAADLKKGALPTQT